MEEVLLQSARLQGVPLIPGLESEPVSATGYGNPIPPLRTRSELRFNSAALILVMLLAATTIVFLAARCTSLLRNSYSGSTRRLSNEEPSSSTDGYACEAGHSELNGVGHLDELSPGNHQPGAGVESQSAGIDEESEPEAVPFPATRSPPLRRRRFPNGRSRGFSKIKDERARRVLQDLTRHAANLASRNDGDQGTSRSFELTYNGVYMRLTVTAFNYGSNGPLAADIVQFAAKLEDAVLETAEAVAATAPYPSSSSKRMSYTQVCATPSCSLDVSVMASSDPLLLEDPDEVH